VGSGLEALLLRPWREDTVLVGTSTGSEVVASFAADLGVPAWEMGNMELLVRELGSIGILLCVGVRY
jgi:hypothetical protein